MRHAISSWGWTSKDDFLDGVVKDVHGQSTGEWNLGTLVARAAGVGRASTLASMTLDYDKDDNTMTLASSKANLLQAYTMLVYRKALHPEFFGIQGRMRIEHEDFEFEAWIFAGGQAVRFQHENTCVCEVVTDQFESLPERGLVSNMACAGERDYEETFGDTVSYMTAMQTETLSDHLYLSTYREMCEHARQSNSLMVISTEDTPRPSMSLLDVQRYRNEVHVQGFQLKGDSNLVLRTQSMFRLKLESTDEESEADEI